MAEQAKITSLNGIIIGEGCVFSSDNFKNSSENVITLPSTSGTLALTSDITTATAGIVTETGTQTLSQKTLTEPIISSIKKGSATLTLPSTSGTLALAADVNAQKERIDRLLNYLEKWINVGNLTMSDIKTSVNASS